ncbi:glycosyltransferase [Microbacterium sp.]|uniref:glycosyltransferase n=1 Tax=Microbacterium sp. TaxID=51671 RepID=UPI003A8AFA81
MHRRSPLEIAVTIGILAAVAVLMVGHAVTVTQFINLALLQVVLFCHLMLKLLAAVAAPPHVVAEGFDLSGLRADIVIPVYNEDPDLLAAGLRSITTQTMLPRAVWVIDDGSQQDGQPFLVLETDPVRRALAAAAEAGIEIHPIRQTNRGKRWAQSVAFEASDADVFITIDSDTYLDSHAVEKLLVPFSRREVQSVAGLPTGMNYRKNLLTRVVDLSFTMSSLQGRMAEGFFGAVRVNCGIIAAYRADVVRENLDRYLNQVFLGAPVKAGDDRALTYFAKERGRNEFQPEAIAYSALPETLGHLARQRLRWARSWCWGTLLLLRRPVGSAEFWFTLMQLAGIFGFGLVVVIIVVGSVTGSAPISAALVTLLFAMLVGGLVHARYVVLAHRHDPLAQRVLTWLASPVGTALYVCVLLPLYYVAIVRPVPRRGWGTRATVEVALDTSRSAVPLRGAA